jgi:cyclic-di-GMP phosphodiesterase TipF (flagellum assembly factor)
MRIGSIFIIICMALIAAAIGAALHYAAGVQISVAAYISLVILFALTTCVVIASRGRDREELADRFEELSRASSDLARELGAIGRRVAALETASTAELKSLTVPITREITELADLVEDLAESVAVHDALIAMPRQQEAISAPPFAASKLEADEKFAFARVPPPPWPFDGRSEKEIAAIVREALDEDRIDLFMQPVVTLPQRKVRFYEALSRLRMADGKIVEAKEFIPAARTAGLISRIDQKLVSRCVNIVRRLAIKNRDVSLFLNLATETLRDGKIFPELLGYLDANRAVAPSLVLEFAQASFRALGPSEQINLALLVERGFPISLDRLVDLKLDPRTLSERGVRFIKVPGELLLKRVNEPMGQIHPADLADTLARFGIDLIAECIENDAVVVDLLDFDVCFGQGFLFSPPRPVRAEILQPDQAAERRTPPLAMGASTVAQIVHKIS